MSRFQPTHASIASGATLSGQIALTGAKLAGLIAYVPTSCQVFIQVSWDQTSANFTRAWLTNGSSTWAWNVGSGYGAVTLQDVAIPFPYARIEAGVAQVGTCSLTTVVKF